MSDFNLQYAIKSEPTYSIRGQLAQREDSWLCDMAIEPEININPEQDRLEIIDGIAKSLTSMETLRQFLICFKRRELDFFREASRKHEIEGSNFELSQYGLSCANGLITLYYHDGGYVCVMPEEVRESFKKLEMTSFPTEWERCELLRTYGRAAAELYGVIKVNDIIYIFNSQNAEQTTIFEFIKAVSGTNDVFGDPIIKKKYLYNSIFDDAPWEEIMYFVNEAAQKPRYIPPKEEMLAAGEIPYIPETTQTIAVERFLTDDIHLKRVKAENAVGSFSSMGIGYGSVRSEAGAYTLI